MYAVRSVLLKNLLGFDWWVALGWVSIVLAEVSVAELVVFAALAVAQFQRNTFVGASVVGGVGREALVLRTNLLDFLDLFDWGIYSVVAGSFVGSHYYNFVGYYFVDDWGIYFDFPAIR